MGSFIVSPMGKAIILLAFLTLTVFSGYACANITVDFSFDTYLADSERLIFKYRDLKNKHNLKRHQQDQHTG